MMIYAGKSHYRQQGKNQSYGTEVGTAFSVGAKTGWSFYAKEGFSKGKQESEGKTYHNSHIDTDTLNISSGKDTALIGATAKAKTIYADIKGHLHIESQQDEHKQNSKQFGLGTKVEFGFGSSWEFSGNASAEGGKSNSKQVNEQAGLFAEEGGYHISADNVHLKGGVIASTNAKNSELTTNKLTFEDIRNSSSHSATSGSISGSYGKEADYHVDNETGEKVSGTYAKNNPNSTTKIVPKAGPKFNPALPMHEQGEDSTATKATLTEGKITLNKDSQPTETTAVALGINTDLSQANKQVEQPKDVNRLLKEQKEISANVGYIATAASNFSNQQAKEAEAEKRKAGEELAKAKASGDVAKIDEKQSAYNEASIKAEAWGEGGSNRRKVDATVAVVGAILAGKTTAQAAVVAVSPELNAQIHEITKDSKTANLFAHAALSAAEFYVAGLDPASGALAGVVGEGRAMLLAEKVFNKQPSELTAEEKGLLKAASQLAGAIAGGVASNSTATAVEGMATAKRAVENNFLSQKEWEELERLSKKKVLTYNEALRVVYLTKKDVNSDKLLSQYQAQFNGGKALSDIETATLLKWVAEYGSRADQTVLLHTPVNAPQIRPDYSDLITKSKKIVSYGNTFESRQAESLKVGLETVAGLGVNNAIINTTGKLGTAILNSDKVAKITHSALVVNSGLNNAGKALVNVAQRYPLTTELSVTGIVNTGYQLSQDRPYNPYDLLQAGFSTALTRNKSLDKQLSINVMLSTLNTENSSDYGWNALGAVSGTIAGSSESNYKFGNKYADYFFKPILSNYMGEYFGDSDRIKEIFFKNRGR